MAEKKQGGWGVFFAAIVGCFLFGFVVFGNVEFDDWFLKQRLNARFGADTTKDWKVSEDAVDLISQAYLLSPKATRVAMHKQPNYTNLVKLATYWNQKLKTEEGKEALKLADDAVADNFEKCVENARRLKGMMDD